MVRIGYVEILIIAIAMIVIFRYYIISKNSDIEGDISKESPEVMRDDGEETGSNIKRLDDGRSDLDDEVPPRA